VRPALRGELGYTQVFDFAKAGAECLHEIGDFTPGLVEGRARFGVEAGINCECEQAVGLGLIYPVGDASNLVIGAWATTPGSARQEAEDQALMTLADGDQGLGGWTAAKEVVGNVESGDQEGGIVWIGVHGNVPFR